MIGDPTVIGWATCFAYLLTAWLCYRAAARASRPLHLNRGGPMVPVPRRRRARIERVWLALAALLAFLGINKQLDLQLQITNVGRWLAQRQGWYENRMYAKLAFVTVLVFTVIGAWVFLLRQGRGRFREIGLAILGAALVGVYVLVRGVSYDVLDVRVRVLGVQLHEAIELTGIVLIACSAGLFPRFTRDSRQRFLDSRPTSSRYANRHR
jgi:hypothetical protein